MNCKQKVFQVTQETDVRILKPEQLAAFAHMFRIDDFELCLQYLDYMDLAKKTYKKFALMTLLGGNIYKSGKSGISFFKDSPNFFYNQLVLRCFNDVKQNPKAITDRYVKILCDKNVQKSCIMYAMMSYNMAVESRCKLNKLAKTLFSNSNVTDIAFLKEINTKSEKAIKIMRPTLIINP